MNLFTLNDSDNSIFDIYNKLSEPALFHINEPEPGLFIAESPEVIERAIASGYEPESILCEERYLNTQTASIVAKFPDVPVYTASLDILTTITGFKLTRGLLCAMKRRPLPTLSEVALNHRRIAVLEGVVNPTNVGAIMRSAAAMHVDSVILSPDSSDPLYRRASRVSMGTVFQIPWTYACDSCTDWYSQGVDMIQSLGFTTVAMALKEDSIPISDPVLEGIDKMAIFLGAEGEGLRDTTIDACDYKVVIPMSHGVDSLNVAAASAVAFWELCGSVL